MTSQLISLFLSDGRHVAPVNRDSHGDAVSLAASALLPAVRSPAERSVPLVLASPSRRLKRGFLYKRPFGKSYGGVHRRLLELHTDRIEWFKDEIRARKGETLVRIRTLSQFGAEAESRRPRAP